MGKQLEGEFRACPALRKLSEPGLEGYLALRYCLVCGSENECEQIGENVWRYKKGQI